MNRSDYKVGMKLRGKSGTIWRVVYVGQSVDRVDCIVVIGKGVWTRGRLASWDFDEFNKSDIVRPRKSNSTKHKQLYIATTKGGMTEKGLANQLNRGKRLDYFGNSPTHALSNWENKHGKQLDIDNGIMWKLVPFEIRKDKRNGRYRIGREIK